LPRLRGALRDNAVLVVIDNAETLLTDARTWRDPLWGLLIDTLVAHGGLSRLGGTSRHTPTRWGAHPPPPHRLGHPPAGAGSAHACAVAGRIGVAGPRTPQPSPVAGRRTPS